jgi:hypothetical protein
MTYDFWVSTAAPAIRAEYTTARGSCSAEDEGHALWRLAYENWDLDQVLLDIREPGAGHPGHEGGSTPPPFPEPPPSNGVGVPSLTDRRLLVDGDRYRGITAFPLLHVPQDIALQFMDTARSLGFNVLRCLTHATVLFPLSREAAYDRLPWTLAEAQSRGLTLEAVALADTRQWHEQDLLEHLDVVAGIVGHNAFLQVANEHYHDTQHPELHDVSTMIGLESRVREYLSTGSTTYSDEDTGEPLGRYVTRHLDRGRDPLNMIRRVRELAAVYDAVRRPVLNDEPIGYADVEVPGRRLSDKNYFGLMGLLQSGFSVDGTFHWEGGLRDLQFSGPAGDAAREYVWGSTFTPPEAFPAYKNAGHAGSPVKSIGDAEGQRTIEWNWPHHVVLRAEGPYTLYHVYL